MFLSFSPFCLSLLFSLLFSLLSFLPFPFPFSLPPSVSQEQEEISARAQALSRIIAVAEVCLEPLHNYDGLMALSKALNSHAVHHLKKTWARLDKKTMRTWKKLEELCASGARKLHTLMADALPPCVPYIGLHLDTLVVLSGYPSEVDGGLINFTKLRQHGDLIGEIGKHQQTPFLFEVNNELQMSLKAQSKYGNEDAAWKRRLEIEPRDS